MRPFAPRDIAEAMRSHPLSSDAGGPVHVGDPAALGITI